MSPASTTHSQERIRAATAARLQMGLNTDSVILNKIKENPGISTYHIAKILHFSIGRVDGSISRLQERKEINLQYVLREGRMIKEIYPKGFTQQEAEVVRFDKELLESPDKWKKKAYIYALDRITLGIAPTKSDEWEMKALAKEDVEVQESKDQLLIRIPPRLADFYIWKNSTSDLAIIGDLALLTLKTSIPIHTPAKDERAELETLTTS
ncbi:MAG: hypothetical protein HYY22_09335 [Thaumarchaeota archaeon]|nr:hypothetical protein [Nitrososphaerota archaeon]